MNEEKLRELYIEKEWGINKISEKFGIGTRNYLDKYGIETRSPSKKVEISKNQLKNLYYNKNLSLTDIADRFECSANTVKRRMKEHGLEIRSQTPIYDIDEDKLYELYYEKENTLKEVANFFDVSTKVITNRMDKKGWERRKTRPETIKGKDHHLYGKSLSEERKQKISKANKGRTWEEIYDEETLEKQRDHIKNLNYWEGRRRPELSGENHPYYGKELSKEHRKKISEGVKKAYEEIEGYREQKKKNLQGGFAAYNSEACKIIEEFGKNHGYSFQHAENGGEHYFEDIKYFVDGYDEKQNTVIEYYETHHKSQREKDRRRKREIIETANCSFIEIYEEGFIKVNWS